MFPPSEIFDIMQDGRCNYNKDLWQRLSRPPTDACRSAWWHHHSSTKHHSNSCKGFQLEWFSCTITSCGLCIIPVISIYNHTVRAYRTWHGCIQINMFFSTILVSLVWLLVVLKCSYVLSQHHHVPTDWSFLCMGPIVGSLLITVRLLIYIH